MCCAGTTPTVIGSCPGAVDHHAVLAVGGDPDADPGGHLVGLPAGLVVDERGLVVVGEQIGRALDQVTHHRPVRPGQLLGRVGGERQPALTAFPGVPEHRLRIVGADHHQVDRRRRVQRAQLDLARLAHRPRVEGGDLGLVGVGGADEARGVQQFADVDRRAVHAVPLQPGAVVDEVLADGPHQQRVQAQAGQAEGDVRRHPAPADLQVVDQERQCHPVESLGDQAVAEAAPERHQMVGGDGSGDSDTHGATLPGGAHAQRTAAGPAGHRDRAQQKLSPQAQLAWALGLSMVKPCFCSVST